MLHTPQADEYHANTTKGSNGAAGGNLPDLISLMMKMAAAAGNADGPAGK